MAFSMAKIIVLRKKSQVGARSTATYRTKISTHTTLPSSGLHHAAFIYRAYRQTLHRSDQVFADFK